MGRGGGITALLDDPRHGGWGKPDWPDWMQGFRPVQQEAVRQILDAYAAGHSLVVLEAPVGAGKTAIAEAVRRILNPPRTCYVCTDKSLQDQFVRSFPYADEVRGRANYPTLDDAHRFPRISCDDCTRTRDDDTCNHCHDVDLCPYRVAKARAVASPLSCTNTHYFIAECNHVGTFTRNGKAPVPFVIADECDLLEGVLLSHESVTIPWREAQKLGIGRPDRKTVPEAWREWFRSEAIPAVDDAQAALKGSNSDADRKLRERYVSLLARLRAVANEVADGNWVYVYTPGRRGREDSAPISFRPVRVAPAGRKLLWNHGQRWLLMSATVISSDELLDSLGYTTDTGDVAPHAFVRMGSAFDPARYPIRMVPVANMSRSEQDVAYPAMLRAIRRVSQLHPYERILVHTVSYRLASYLHNELTAPDMALRDPVSALRAMTYRNGREREDALRRFRETKGGMLIAPSLDRGIDLAYDDCRVVVVAKAPWLSLGDKQVTARRYSEGGSLWYTVAMIRTLVQMVGRAMRAPDDACSIYILDTSAVRVYEQHRPRRFYVDGMDTERGGLFPKWFSDAVETSGRWARDILAPDTEETKEAI